MIKLNLKCGLLISIFAFLVACQHPTVAPATPAEFLVSPEQSRQINSIIISVSAELSASNYASFTEKKTTNTLGKYDSQIHNILSPEQWVEYDLHQREYWAYKIFTKMKRYHQSKRWGPSVSGAQRPDSGGDRRDGTFGLNDSNSR